MPDPLHDGEILVDERLVRSLLRAQRPEVAEGRLRVVEPWGTDHAIWRLGRELVVRLPRIQWAQHQIELEATWLPRLAPALPIAVPQPVFVGRPGAGYGFPWAIHRWLPGISASPDTIADPGRFALDLAGVVGALGRLSTAGAPAARHRARPLRDYDREARAAIAAADGLIDTAAAASVWDDALRADPHRGPGVWVHGDLEGNCLMHAGRLSGLIDWGSACAGDPAVDVQVIWSMLFTPCSRATFVDALAVDDATIARSRGAAIHQACAALPYYRRSHPLMAARARHKLAALGVPLHRDTTDQRPAH